MFTASSSAPGTRESEPTVCFLSRSFAEDGRFAGKISVSSKPGLQGEHNLPLSQSHHGF
jgi:hypothetical protein